MEADNDNANRAVMGEALHAATLATCQFLRLDPGTPNEYLGCEELARTAMVAMMQHLAHDYPEYLIQPSACVDDLETRKRSP